MSRCICGISIRVFWYSKSKSGNCGGSDGGGVWGVSGVVGGDVGGDVGGIGDVGDVGVSALPDPHGLNHDLKLTGRATLGAMMAAARMNTTESLI